MASAEELAGIAHRRASLVEAVTALEVAVAAFARMPDAQTAFGSKLANRMRLQSLESEISQLELSSAIKYLFPVIFTEEQLPTEVLRGCQESVEQRQSVVHNGQRNVDRVKLQMYLTSRRSAYSILGSYEETLSQ